MKKGKVLVTLSTFCEFESGPRNILKESEFNFTENKSGKRMDPKEILSLGTDWVGIVAGVEQYSADTLRQLTYLKCISRVGVGIDAIDANYALQNHIMIRNTPDAPTVAVAEMTIAQMLDLLKLVSFHDKMMKNKMWSKKTGLLLSNKTVGIVGLGRIGKKVAQLLKGFDVRLLGYDTFHDDAWASSIGLRYCTLDQLLCESDIITLHAAAPKTSGAIIGKKEILEMKDGSFIVNTARGSLIDESAMIDALKRGKLAGAAMDVFPVEPYTGEYCELPNVILTPHVATLTKETRTQMEKEAVRNLLEELRKTC